jgi:hypothetical protein
MAAITDEVVVRFCDERVRQIADHLERISYELTAWQADYAAQTIAARIAGAAAGDVVNQMDAAAGGTDGRNPITKTTLINFKAAIDQVATAVNTTAVSGVGTTAKACFDSCQVNGSPR